MTTDFLEYIMEDAQEIERLELKTDRQTLLKQAHWAGLAPGMRVADIGCGPGLTSHILCDAVQPGGQVVGVDFSAERVQYAQNNYAKEGLSFHRENFFGDLSSLGTFDFIWARFVLEFHRSRAIDLIANLDKRVRPGGILCLIDLDYNCLSHSGLPERVDKTIKEVVAGLEKNADFDPYAGRRLYSHLYDLEYQDIRVYMAGHHVIYGALQEADRYNWERKVLVAARRSGCSFSLYDGDFDAFADEFTKAFNEPRRFTYTPLICCCGVKPLEA